jgi:hypothetical protein
MTMEDYDNIAVPEGSFKFEDCFPANLIGSGAFLDSDSSPYFVRPRYLRTYRHDFRRACQHATAR